MKTSKLIFFGLMIWLALSGLQGCGGGDGTPGGSAPSAPTGATAVAGDKQITISWKAVANATSYNIYWSTTSGVTPANGNKITGTTSPYTQTGLSDGMTYYYVVTAVNSYGESTPSSQVSATPESSGSPPAAPTGVTAVAADKQATISWNAVPGATSYNIYWSTTSGVTPANGNKITGATSPYTQTGLSDGTTYYYVVTAVNSYGESTPSSQVSAIPESSGSPPAAPTGVTATAGDSQISISWNAVANTTSYNIYWSTTSGVTPANGNKITGATSPYTQTGLSDGTTYYYVVTAVNSFGESPPSSQVNAIPTAPSYKFSVLYNFPSGSDGAELGGFRMPNGGLLMDSAGNIYGTTEYGGASGNGTVFKLDANGNVTVLYSFAGGPSDGATPAAALIMDSNGNLYGTTAYGGAYDSGTAFKLNPIGNETVLHSFNINGNDGTYPWGQLLMDNAGNLYGTTAEGGVYAPDAGTVFKIDINGNETVLHSFGNVGENPLGGLVMDSNGNLYGTTSDLRNQNFINGSPFHGMVFKIDVNGSFNVLHWFNGTDGHVPFDGLIMDKNGYLYGTTTLGGAFNDGVVFKMDTSGNETVLHSFSGKDDGGFPTAGLVMDSEGNLYGATQSGGANGKGAVFKLDTSGNETVLYSFTGGADGGSPETTLVMDGSGNLYGNTYNGGANGAGTIFKLTHP